MTPEQASLAYLLVCFIWFSFRLRTLFNRNDELTLKDFILNAVFIFTPILNIVFFFVLIDNEDLFGDVVLLKRKQDEG